MRYRNVSIALLVIAAVMIAAVGPVTAHDTQNVEGYEITFGGADEPVITGERMWLEFHIVDSETGEPVEGQADSLIVSIQQADGEKVELDVREKHGTPGVYEAAVIFTEPDDYMAHLEGSIEDTDVHTHFEKQVRDHNDLKYAGEEESGDEDTRSNIPAVDPMIIAGLAVVSLVAAGVVLFRR